jgi:hypothetical protein
MVYPELAFLQALFPAMSVFRIFAVTRPHFSQAPPKSPPFAGFSQFARRVARPTKIFDSTP